MKYQTGIEVNEGDIVAVRHGSSAVEGVVRKLILPKTVDPSNWSAPEGGVLIEGGGLGLSLTKSLEDDEDVSFVRRADGFIPNISLLEGK